MVLSSSVVYLAGAALVVVALLLGRSRRGHSVRTRDVSGNMIVGDISGPVSQGAVPPPATPPPGAASKSFREWVAWIVGIAGFLLALAKFVHDMQAGR